MSGDGADNAHNNAFSGGKNPGMGNAGSGSHSGSSGKGGNGGSHRGGMRAPTASEVAGQFNSYGGTQISASQVSNIRGDGDGGYSADIKGQIHTVSSGGESHTSNTVGGFSGVSTSGHGNGNNNGGSGGSGGNGSAGNGKGKTTTSPGWSSDSGKPGSYLPTKKDKLIKGLIKSIDDHSSNGTGSYTIHYTGGAVATVTVPNGDVNKMNVHYDIGGGPASGNKLTRDTIKSFLEFKAEVEANAVKDAISKVNDFYKELTSKYGDKLAKEARALAEEARGKKLRNAKEAIDAFNKYKDVLNKKFSVADREAIAKALESLNKEQMAKQLKIFGKAFGVAGEAIQWGGFIHDLAKGFRTGDWNDAIMSGEKIAAGKVASVMVTVAFSAMAVNPVGILGFAVIMAVTSSLITDERLKQLNDFISDF